MIKTNINTNSNIKSYKTQNINNNQISNINNNSKSTKIEELSLDIENSKPLSEYRVSEILDIIPQNGNLTRDDIDFKRISISSSDAISENFLNSVSTSWGDNGQLTYEIFENGAVLIKEGNISMGFTDIEGISKIITDVQKKNVEKKENVTTQNIKQVTDESSTNKVTETSTKSIFNDYSTYSNMIWDENDVNNVTDVASLVRINKSKLEYSNKNTEVHNLINKSLDDEGWFGKGTTLGENGATLKYDKKETSGDYTIYYNDGKEIKRIKGSHVYFEQSKTSYEIGPDGSVTIHSKSQSTSYTDIYKIDGSVEKYVNGRVCHKIYPDGTKKSYRRDGTTYISNNEGQTIQDCYSNGKVRTQYIKDGKVEYIEYYYFTDGSKYEKYSYTDGTSSLVEYSTDGKTIIAETTGTVMYSNDCPKDKEMICKDDYGGKLPGYDNDAITKRREDNGYTISYYGDVKNDVVNKICNSIELGSENIEHYDSTGNLLYIENKSTRNTTSGAYFIETNIINPNGTCTVKGESFDSNGNLTAITTEQYDQNVLREETFVNNEQPEFNRREVYDESGNCIERYNENNLLWYEVKDGVTYNYDISTGLPSYIQDSNGTTYYRNGKAVYYVDNNGNYTHY